MNSEALHNDLLLEYFYNKKTIFDNKSNILLGPILGEQVKGIRICFAALVMMVSKYV